MKRLLLTLVMISVMAVSLSAQVVEKTYHFSSPYFERYQDYEQLVFDGCTQIAQEGCPSLPWQPVSLLLPYNTEAENVEYEFLDYVEIDGEHLIYPYQQARPLSETRELPFLKNDNIYLSSETYPAQNVSDVKTHYLNGYSVAMSGFTPVRYVPSTGKLSYAQTVKVRVTYSSSRTDKSKMLKVTPEHKARVQRLAHNPEMSDAYDVRAQRVIGGYELLVVTPAEWVSRFDEYKAFYDSQGLRTKVVALEDIYASSDGRDEQDKIRTFISQEYENESIMMVLLGGDTKLVPYRGLYCYVSEEYQDNAIPADMYYVCLDGTWNTDNDTLWGEVGEEDLLPELAIGRLPFNNEMQFNNMMHKTLEYQSNPVLGEFNDVILGAEHLGDGYYGRDDLELLIGEQDDSNYTTIGIPEDYTFHRYYAKPDKDWNATEFRNKINDVGGGYVYHVGHANTDYVAGWYLINIDDDSFAKLNGIDHNYNFFHSHGCICGDFSSTCILEKLINMPNGFVAATGNSRYGWYIPWGDGPARHLNRELVDAYYNDKLKYIGEAFVEMKIMTAPLVSFGGYDNSALRWNMYCINILGDVAVSPWLDEPFVPEVDYTPALAFGTTNTTVNVKKDGEAQNNFRCSLFHENQLLAFGKTNNNGKAVLYLNEPLNVQDTLKLIVSGPNAWCQTYDVIGIDENMSYIYADDVIINDSDGNSNACLDYGESIKLDVDFYNLGFNDVDNIIATLSSTSNEIVEITNAEANISEITSNSVKTITNAFSLKVKEKVQDQSYAYFTLTCNDGDNVYKQNLRYKVLAPDLNIVKADYDDSNGNSDGIVDVGESVQIHVFGKNKGHSACDNILIKAVSHNDHVIFSNNEKTISRLEAGANFMTTFSFVIDDNTPEGSVVEIDVTIVSGDYEDRKNVRFTVGGVKEDFETGDFLTHNWKNDEIYPWVITDENSNSGRYSAQSALIGDNEMSSLLIDVEIADDGELSFYLKTSTEERNDFLAFFVDDKMMDRWSGENDWQQVSYPIKAGSHTLEWFYDKNMRNSAGEDRCWIDDILFPVNTFVLGVESIVEEKSIVLYPNPTENFFNIEADNIQSVEMFDVMGSKIMSHNVTSSNVIDVTNIPDGLYFVRILDDDGNVIVKKLIKR